MSCSDNVCSLSTVRSSRTASPPNEIHQGIANYYQNPVMTKISSPNPIFSMYAVGVTCFCPDRRYLIAVCQNDINPVGSTLRLSELNWVSFQARVSPTNYPVPSQFFDCVSNSLTKTQINSTMDEGNVATYIANGYRLKVQLLGDTYRSRGTLEEALQTYSTVLFFY